MMEVTLSAGVTGPSTAVTGLCEGFEGLSAVDVHQDAGRECVRRVCIAAGVMVVGGCERRKETGVCGGAECVIGDGVE
jgi:hypothetical protein